MTLLDRARRALDAFRNEPVDPPSPDTLEQEIRAFRVMHPDATPDEWEAFAFAQTRNAYQRGWIDGATRDEDDPLWSKQEVSEPHPYVARVLSLGYDPNNPLGRATEGERAELYRFLLRGWTLPEMEVTTGGRWNTSSNEEEPASSEHERSETGTASK